MSEQEARETACAIFGGNGDFYSFRKKAHNSTNEANVYEAAGFTESQINKVIEIPNGGAIEFKIGERLYTYKKGQTKIKDGLIYIRESYDSVIIYPVSMIYYIRVYDVKQKK